MQGPNLKPIFQFLLNGYPLSSASILFTGVPVWNEMEHGVAKRPIFCNTGLFFNNLTKREKTAISSENFFHRHGHHHDHRCYIRLHDEEGDLDIQLMSHVGEIH